jgi:hypothetical protein
MDYWILALGVIAGALISYLFFGGSSPGFFDGVLMESLKLGKKVIICVDSECYIFELNGTRMRITRGVSTMLEEYDELQSLGVVTSNADQSTDNPESGG